MKYWINTVSRDHVLIGKELGIIQAGHGKSTPLKRLSPNDLVVYYSPKTSISGGESVRSFTAVCQIKNEPIYQAEVEESFCPFRRNASYLKCEETEILPLIENLSFIKNKKSWGYVFRFGLFPIPEEDFALIAEAMKLEQIE